MKQLFVLLCFNAVFIIQTYGQFKDPGFSFAVEPTLGNRILGFKNAVTTEFKDSLKKADKSRDAIGASFTVSFKTGKRQRIYTGLQFHNFGFTRKKDNLHFLDTIHPAIGIMNDLSQTGGAYVDFNYRYLYLSLPILFSTQLSGKKKPNTKLHAIYGGSVSGLVKHDIRAILHGFSTRGGQKVYSISNKAGEPERINVNFNAGLRIETIVYNKETWLFVQPELFIPLLSANNANERHHLWAVGLQIGVYYQPMQDKSIQ